MSVPASHAVTAASTAAAITMPEFPAGARRTFGTIRVTIANTGSTVVYVTNVDDDHATAWAVPVGDTRTYDFPFTADSALALYSSSNAVCRVYATLL